MEMPIIIFFVLYLIALGFFAVGSAFVIYHAIRFGQASRLNKVTMTTYISVSIIIVGISLWYASLIDWAQRIDMIEAFELLFL